MSAFLKVQEVFTNLAADSFPELVDVMAAPLLEAELVTLSYPQQVIAREEKFPTGLPTEPLAVAIPHTDAEYVRGNAIVVATLAEPLHMGLMGGDEGESVDAEIIFLLALADGNKHLNLLKDLMKVLQDRELLAELKQAESDEIKTRLEKALGR